MYQRVTSFFGYEFIAGSYLFFIFCITFFYYEKFDLKKLIFLSLIYLGVFFSGDRTPFISLNLLIILIIYFNIKNILNNPRSKIYFSFILFAFFSFFILNEAKILNLSAFDKYKNTFRDLKDDIVKIQMMKII